jgi:hypothetical protein
MDLKKLTKEQQQVALLAAVGVIIVGVLAWFYGGALLPKPTGTQTLPPSLSEMSFPQGNEQALYARPDFQALHRFGSVPVRPTGPTGSPDPFAAAATGR